MTTRLPLLPTLATASARHDLVAALTLAAVAIPEQLATAQLAGLPAAQGLVVFAAASVAMLLVARDATLSVGADSTIAPLVAAVLAATGAGPGDAALLAALIGAVLLAVCLLRLEWIADLLSKPVAGGMLAGIALHILVGRLPTALGLALPPAGPVATLTALWHHEAEARAAPLAMALAVAALCLAGHRIGRRLPAALAAVTAAMAAAVLADPAAELFPRVTGLAGVPDLALPTLSLDRATDLLPVTVSIAFLCLSQTTVVLRAGRTDSAQARRNAFGAVGLANLATAAIGGFAVNASPPRTQLLREAGARSQVAGLLAAVAGLALLVTGAGLLAQLPAAALAGVLIYIAIHLMGSAALPDILRRSPTEGAIALATAALVTLLPLTAGLPAAILLSLVYAALPAFRPRVVTLRNVPGTTVWWHRPETPGAPGHPGVLVLGLTSPINFANSAGTIAGIRAHLARLPQPPRLLVLECAGVLAVDLTGADALAGLVEALGADGLRIALARLESDRARRDMERSGLIDRLGSGNVFQSVDAAIRALDVP